MFRYRKRRLAMYLVIAVIALSFVASSFIWKINILETENVKSEKIKTLLNQIGVTTGKNKLFISKGKIADYIRANTYEAAWVGVDINGTTLKITIKEKVISKEEDKTEPGNIVAIKSGIITKIIAENGTAKFKTGSYIKKGNIAIEGSIQSEIIEPIKVHASGTVRAKVEYVFKKEYKYKEKIKEYTGKSRYGAGLKINNKEFMLKYLPKENKYDINSIAKMFEVFSVNVSFIFNTYDEYILKDIINTKENLEIRGNNDSTLYFEELLTDGSKIVDKKVVVEEKKDGIIYKVVANVEENIGKFIKTGDK